MSNITKEKSKFIITLDNGKQTYFDFADENYYGLNGRRVKTFNKEAAQILSKHDNDLLAWFFYYRDKDYPAIKAISPALIETVYSLYHEYCSIDTLTTIVYYCHNYHFKLDKNGVRAINAVLNLPTNKTRKFRWTGDFARAMTEVLHPNFSSDMREIYNSGSQELRDAIDKDGEKIMFYMEHENWTAVFNGQFYGVRETLNNYVNMANLLGKEPIWKNLFLQVGYMAREYSLRKVELTEEYQTNAPLFFEDDNFITVIPTKAEEFQEEANKQHNCVYSMYYEKVCKRSTHVVFIRRKKNPEKSYITCEVDNNGNIKQYLARFNKEVADTNAISFRAKYQNYLNSKF